MCDWIARKIKYPAQLDKIYTMKSSVSCLVFLTILIIQGHAQNSEKYAPPGFDSLRAGIPSGKIDTITYQSKTVGTARRALIYTPPGYSKKKQVPGSLFIAWYRRR